MADEYEVRQPVSIRYLTVHRVQQGDTVASLTERYGLGCNRALTDIEANQRLNLAASPSTRLETGAVVQIPPDARQLVRNRIYALYALRPQIVTHFDDMQAQTEARVLPLLVDEIQAEIPERINTVLAELGAELQSAIDRITESAQALVQICEALACTYVGDSDDRAAAGAIHDPMCGIAWSVTPAALDLWRNLWAAEMWFDKWSGKSPLDAQQTTARFVNTVRSIITQKIDQRLRDAQSLQRRLEADFGG